MIIYCLSSPGDPIIMLTASVSAVVAAQKGAERDGVILEIGTWDTDRSPICTISLNIEDDTSHVNGNTRAD